MPFGVVGVLLALWLLIRGVIDMLEGFEICPPRDRRVRFWLNQTAFFLVFLILIKAFIIEPTRQVEKPIISSKQRYTIRNK
ncbi:MAG: hypothetical protein JSR76_03725 [Verrucomicrobia bacterium]|nr:hypothetical protein [Verrucomicrobiota bacterium]